MQVTDPSVELLLHPPFTCEQDPKIAELPECPPQPGGEKPLSLVKNQGLTIGQILSSRTLV